MTWYQATMLVATTELDKKSAHWWTSDNFKIAKERAIKNLKENIEKSEGAGALEKAKKWWHRFLLAQKPSKPIQLMVHLIHVW